MLQIRHFRFVCVIGVHVYFIVDTSVLLEVNKVSPRKQVPRFDSLRMSLEQLSFFSILLPSCLSILFRRMLVDQRFDVAPSSDCHVFFLIV